MGNSLEIHAYDRDHLPPEEIAWEAVLFFAENYPTVHGRLDRARDLAKHGSVGKIMERLKQEYILMIQRGLNERIQGLLEWRPLQVDGGIYAQLAWLMTDERLRHSGIGTSLHDDFVAQAEQLKRVTRQPVALQLSVHKDNPARTFWHKLGYKVWSQSPSDHNKVFMGREL